MLLSWGCALAWASAFFVFYLIGVRRSHRVKQDRFPLYQRVLYWIITVVAVLMLAALSNDLLDPFSGYRAFEFAQNILLPTLIVSLAVICTVAFAKRVRRRSAERRANRTMGDDAM